MPRAQVKVTTLKIPIYRYEEDPFPPLHRKGTGRVYPYPMQNEITDDLEEREFEVVLLSNGLLEATIVPGLGGHILSLRDLVHDRELFYKNIPIKFGLIALRGAWYSGGMEFNFPQVGHTVTTNEPLSWHYKEEADGSATVYLGTVERLTEMAWTVGVGLRSDDWRLHISVFLFNRTPFYHRIYFWTNLAVPATEDFQFLVPCTTVYSWWWGEKGIASYPIHRGRDLSLYVTHPRPTDLFARDLRADWFGCYYHQKDLGFLHHASRYEVQGRKLWTWGTARHGQVWSQLLSDSGEPYCEIQTGRFVHQGVHRLMAPRTVQTWKETWFPVWGLGGVLDSSDFVVMNAQPDGSGLTVRLFPLVPVPTARLAVSGPKGEWLSEPFDLSPGEPKEVLVPVEAMGSVTIAVRSPSQVLLQTKLLVSGDTVALRYEEPAPHIGLLETEEKEPQTPSDWLCRARSHEERNELNEAAHCYRKALELDPRCCEAMAGLAQWHLKRGELTTARQWGNRALEVDPQSSKALWWLSVADWMERTDPSSEDNGAPPSEPKLMALTADPAFCGAAWALLAEQAARRRQFALALDRFEKSLQVNPLDSKALASAAFCARQAGHWEKAKEFLSRCLAVNPLEPLLWSESYFLRQEQDEGTETIQRIFGSHPYTFLVADADYRDLGSYGTAAVWLGSVGKRHIRWSSGDHPLVSLRLASDLWKIGKVAEALGLAQQASQGACPFVFPSGWSDYEALTVAMSLNPDQPYFHYLMGTWLSSVGRQDEAIGHWKRAVELSSGGEVPIFSWRNAGLIQFHEKQNLLEAVQAYDRSIEGVQAVITALALLIVPADQKGSTTPFDLMWRLYAERDEVLAHLEDHQRRLSAFEMAPEKIQRKPQILARWAEAALRAGRAEQCVELLSRGHFKPWEGEVHLRQVWKDAQMALGHRSRERREWAKAREHYERAAEYPDNLNIGPMPETDDADALFWAGWCALQMGDRDGAKALLHRAVSETQPENARSRPFKVRAAQLLQQLSAGG
ncbi:MAG: DUF5107 domain-containing protein [Armatimonadetes bacterium]|nr:DUF5107 domain-containing protein [Armatimonadota bacterium]MDW8122107.1 DUF5107 domain-containing protein [Armatimonadota bacterium]